MSTGPGSKFRLKLKKPGKILKFDDSDLTDGSQASSSSPRPDVAGKAVLPRSVPNHLLFISILEHLCCLYGRDSKQAHDIFKSICEHLADLQVVSPLLMLDEMSSLRAQYRHSVHRMLVAAVHKANKSQMAHLSLPAPNGHANLLASTLPKPMPVEPGCETDSFVNQTSRYSTEFVQLDKIGQGGFGSVYKAKNKLDGKLYAVKVVRFKHSKPENIFRVLREVKALANLQHTNIVGYNSCWLEYGACSVPSKPTRAASVPNYDLHSEALSDDHVLFLSEEGDHTLDLINPLPKHTFPLTTGPRIKEIGSNCSSLATSPQSNPASPPKHVTVYQRNFSQNDMLSFSSRQASQLNRDLETQFDFSTSSSAVVFENTDTERETWSAMKGDKEDGERPRRRCKFMLDTDEFTDDSLDMDGGSLESKRPETRRVYKRSISCDPVASGEVILPQTHENVHRDFSESDFPLKRSVSLFIQMELCSLTLKEWMQRRNELLKSDNSIIEYTQKNMSIFKQILKAVDYIHSQGVMHRDLKPRNIFLMDNGEHVKVGDFGLAKEDIITSPVGSKSFHDLNSAHTQLVRTASVLSDHTSGIGTSTYAAPEQLHGTAYSTTCDVYSLGMILFELFQRYSTEMERLKSLTNLRNGVIPGYVYKNWPVQTKYIELMTSYKSEVRPSVKTVLTSEMFQSKDQIIADLRARDSEQLNEIEKLRKMVAERDRTIETLLAEMNTSSSEILTGTLV